jgi:hypothetical protein
VHAIRIQPAGRHAAAGKTRLCSNIQHRPQQRPAPRHNGPLSRGTSVKIKIERISGVKVESAESYRVFDSGLFYFYNPEESPVELGETAWAARGRTLQTKTALVVGWLRHSSRITFFVSPNSIQIVNLSTHKTRSLPRTHGAARLWVYVAPRGRFAAGPNAHRGATTWTAARRNAAGAESSKCRSNAKRVHGGDSSSSSGSSSSAAASCCSSRSCGCRRGGQRRRE